MNTLCILFSDDLQEKVNFPQFKVTTNFFFGLMYRALSQISFHLFAYTKSGKNTSSIYHLQKTWRESAFRVKLAVLQLSGKNPSSSEILNHIQMNQHSHLHVLISKLREMMKFNSKATLKRWSFEEQAEITQYTTNLTSNTFLATELLRFEGT